MQDEFLGITRTQEVELDGRLDSDADSQETIVKKESVPHSVEHGDPNLSDDETSLPIMITESSSTTNFSKPMSKV